MKQWILSNLISLIALVLSVTSLGVSLIRLKFDFSLINAQKRADIMQKLLEYKLRLETLIDDLKRSNPPREQCREENESIIARLKGQLDSNERQYNVIKKMTHPWHAIGLQLLHPETFYMLAKTDELIQLVKLLKSNCRDCPVIKENKE